TNATGTAALGNSQYGLFMNGASANTLLNNTVSGNAQDGVNITGGGTPSGIVSWYHANGNASDAIGGNNGTLQGGITFTSGVTGATGDQAFSFNGVDSS